MGQQGNAKAERRHSRKLFDGRYTAEEVHRASFPPDARCGGCGSPKVAIRMRTFYPAKELVSNKPEVAMQLAAQHNGQLPCTEFRGPGNRPIPYVRIGSSYACDMCKAALARAAVDGERKDSNIVTHIDNGPGPDKTIVQVTG